MRTVHRNTRNRSQPRIRTQQRGGELARAHNEIVAHFKVHVIVGDKDSSTPIAAGDVIREGEVHRVGCACGQAVTCVERTVCNNTRRVLVISVLELNCVPIRVNLAKILEHHTVEIGTATALGRGAGLGDEIEDMQVGSKAIRRNTRSLGVSRLEANVAGH